MSRENVELYRRAAKAFNEGDLEAFLAVMDESVEAVPRIGVVEGGYHGHAGVRRWWESLQATFPDFRTEVVEVRDLGDVTLAQLRNRGRGAGSDTPVEQQSWHVARWRDQKLLWWRAYGTEAEALEAVGLSG
jgi:ketosteroid isomerase-like protein